MLDRVLPCLVSIVVVAGSAPSARAWAQLLPRRTAAQAELQLPPPGVAADFGAVALRSSGARGLGVPCALCIGPVSQRYYRLSAPGFQGPGVQDGERRRSSFLQRAYSGALFGALALVLYTQADKHDNVGWAVTSYSAGSALGVMVLTRSREGVHPIGTTIGATVGALPGVLAGTVKGGEDDPSDLMYFVMFLLTAPVGASVGHTLGR